MTWLAQQQEISDPESLRLSSSHSCEDRKVAGPLRPLAMSWGFVEHGAAFPSDHEDPSAVPLTHCLTSISFCPSWPHEHLAFSGLL